MLWLAQMDGAVSYPLVSVDRAMIPVYAGFDEREEYGYHAFVSSVLHNSSSPVSFVPLHLDTMRKFYFGGHRDGASAFTYSKFLIPFLQKWTGWAIFADGSDMICRGDIDELWECRKESDAVMVVKHDYKTKHPRKYIGTKMESRNNDYPCKNWSSLMLINCAHPSWRTITPASLGLWTGEQLHQFKFLPESMVGELPKCWNWIVDEYGPNPDAKILHFTAGIPGFAHYRDAPHADEWAKCALTVTHVTD